MATRNFRPPDTQASSIIGGLVLLLVVGVVAMVVQIARTFSAERNRQWAVAWMRPGSAEPRHQIKLNGTKVGEVVEVGLPEVRVRVEVSSHADPTRLDVTHLAPGDRARLLGDRGAVDLLLPTRHAMIMGWRSGLVHLRLVDSLGRWVIQGGGTARLASSREWTLLARCVATSELRCLSRGDRLAVDGLLFRWYGAQTAVRVLASLDRGAMAEALGPRTEARDTFQVDSTALIGVELRQTGAFGIGKQGLKLVFPGQNPALIGARPVVATRMRYGPPTGWLVSPDSARAVELVTTENLDLEAITAMAGYLSDPALRNTPPRTRWEDIIDGTRGTVGGARGAIDSAGALVAEMVRVSREDSGQGAVGRLVLGSVEQRRFNQAIDALPDLVAELERLATTTTATVDSTGRSLRSLTTRVDSSLGVIEPELVRALQGARTLEDSLVTLSKELEATLVAARKTGKTVGIAVLVKLLASTLLDIARLGGLR